MLSAFLPLLLAVREPDDLSITQRRSPADTRKFLKQQLFNTIGSPAALESMVVQSDECWAVMVMDGGFSRRARTCSLLIIPFSNNS